MSTGSAATNRAGLAEWIITLGLMAIMAGAYYASLSWPRGAAFFPMLLSGAGVALTLLKAGTMLFDRFRPSNAAETLLGRPSAEGSAEGGEIAMVGPDDDDQGDEEALHAAFENSSAQQWLEVIGWLGGFFIVLYAFGLPVALSIFTIAYLTLVARLSVVQSVLYLAGTTGAIYLVLVKALHLPMPEGFLFSLF